jgi:hypothetical protein
VPRKSKKSVAKPEYSIKVVPKKSPQQVTKKRIVKKTKSQPRLTRQQKNKIIITIVLVVLISCLSIFIAYSVNKAKQAYDQAAKTAESFNIIDASTLQESKIIGSNEQLALEIDNYESSPADLQNYALNDYRQLKRKCIVNNRVYGNLSYSIASVADAQYAQIKKNCNGIQTQILKKFGEKWTVVYEGNSPPLCNLTNDLAIPQRVSLNCMIGGTTYLNPNP